MKDIAYYEYNEKGELKPVLRKDAKKNGLYKWIDGVMVRVRDGGKMPIHYGGSDDMGAVQNPVDGKTYDSKSAYYRSVKDSGCVILGNEKVKPRETTSISKEALRSGLKEAAQKHGLI